MYHGRLRSAGAGRGDRIIDIIITIDKKGD